MSQAATRVFDFMCTLAGVDELTVEVADALYEAGCDDSSPHSTGSTIYATFHREAGSLAEAVGSAIRDVERARYGIARVDVEMPVA
jgi:hypothetical protein